MTLSASGELALLQPRRLSSLWMRARDRLENGETCYISISQNSKPKSPIQNATPNF